MTTFIKTKFKISDDQTNIDKKLFNLVHKQGNWTFVVQTFIWTKYNIGFWNPIKIPSQRKKIYSNRSRNNEIGLMWSGQSFGESTISDLESPSNFQVKEEKKYLNRSIKNEIRKLDFCGPESHLRESTI